MESLCSLLVVSKSQNNYLLDIKTKIQQRSLEEGCFQILIDNYNKPVNNWQKIKRICKEKLGVITNYAPQ